MSSAAIDRMKRLAEMENAAMEIHNKSLQYKHPSKKGPMGSNILRKMVHSLMVEHGEITMRDLTNMINQPSSVLDRTLILMVNARTAKICGKTDRGFPVYTYVNKIQLRP